MASSSLSFEQLHEALSIAFGGFVSNGVLSPEVIKDRAAYLFEDLAKLNIREFSVLPPRVIREVIDANPTTIPLVGYTFGETRQNLEQSSPLHGTEEMSRLKYMEGFGLNHGDITYFARVAEIARKTIPGFWLSDESLRRDVENPTKHLSTLNEVWWLSLWPALDSIRVVRAKQLNPPRDVDWSFPIKNATVPGTGKELVINLEVKEVVSSLEGAVHGDYAPPLKDIFEGVEKNGRHKFRASLENEINVVALTILSELTPAIIGMVQQRFRKDPLIDAVLLRTPYDQTQPFSFFYNDGNQPNWLLKKTFLPLCVASPSLEDNSGVIWLKRPDIASSEQIYRSKSAAPDSSSSNLSGEPTD